MYVCVCVTVRTMHVPHCVVCTSVVQYTFWNVKIYTTIFLHRVFFLYFEFSYVNFEHRNMYSIYGTIYCSYLLCVVGIVSI